MRCPNCVGMVPLSWLNPKLLLTKLFIRLLFVERRRPTHRKVKEVRWLSWIGIVPLCRFAYNILLTKVGQVQAPTKDDQWNNLQVLHFSEQTNFSGNGSSELRVKVQGTIRKISDASWTKKEGSGLTAKSVKSTGRVLSKWFQQAAWRSSLFSQSVFSASLRNKEEANWLTTSSN